MRGAFGQQRNHNKEETILNISLLLRISVEHKQEQTIPYHRRTVPSHTVPIHTNTVRTYIPIWTASTFFFLSFLRLSFSSLLRPISLSLFCNLSLFRSLSQTLPFSLSYPLLPLHSPLPNPLCLLRGGGVSPVDPLVGS